MRRAAHEIGLAQLRGGYFTHPRDKLRYDEIYIRNRGWWLDVRLVTLTFIKVLNRWMTLGLLLTAQEKADLIEYLKSL